MSGARTSTLATLRGSIERIESHGETYSPRKVTLGHAEADATLQGGLALGTMHEVFADAGRQSAAATGFVIGLAGRGAPPRPLVLGGGGFSPKKNWGPAVGGLGRTRFPPRPPFGWAGAGVGGG